MLAIATLMIGLSLVSIFFGWYVPAMLALTIAMCALLIAEHNVP